MLNIPLKQLQESSASSDFCMRRISVAGFWRSRGFERNAGLFWVFLVYCSVLRVIEVGLSVVIACCDCII